MTSYKPNFVYQVKYCSGGVESEWVFHGRFCVCWWFIGLVGVTSGARKHISCQFLWCAFFPFPEVWVKYTCGRVHLIHTLSICSVLLLNLCIDASRYLRVRIASNLRRVSRSLASGAAELTGLVILRQTSTFAAFCGAVRQFVPFPLLSSVFAGSNKVGTFRNLQLSSTGGCAGRCDIRDIRRINELFLKLRPTISLVRKS